MNKQHELITAGAASGRQLSALSRVLAPGIVVLLMVGSGSAQGSERDQDRARSLSSSGVILPLERITERVRARHIGDILEVELESEDQGYFYEVEVIDQAGVVRELIYDAATGELLSDKPDD